MHPDHLQVHVDELKHTLVSIVSRRGALALLVASAVGTALDFGDALGRNRHKNQNGQRNRRRNRRNRGRNRDRGRQVNSLTGLEVAGEGTGRSFAGTLDVVRFRREGGRLVAVGELTGEVLGRGGAVLDKVSQTVELPVEIPALGAEVQAQQCDLLVLEIPAITVDVLGMPVVIGPFSVRITSDQLGPLGDLLCELLGDGDLSAALIGLLNRLLERLGELEPAP